MLFRGLFNHRRLLKAYMSERGHDSPIIYYTFHFYNFRELGLIFDVTGVEIRITKEAKALV